jgi:signal transduction histidine kinase
LLETGIELAGAEKGNLQLLDQASGALVVAVQRGFEEAFLKFFAAVRDSSSASCGNAMKSKEPVIVEDVTQSAIYAGQASLNVLLAAGVRAVASFPLISSAGNVLGVISTHFGQPHCIAERELRLMCLLTRQAADYLERKRAQELLIRSEKVAVLGRMAATIAHEINNPLAALMNTLYLARTSPDCPDSVRQYLDVGDDQLKVVSRITTQALGFYRETSAPAKVPLGPLLDEATGLFKSKIEAKRVKVESQYGNSPAVMASAGELRQVFCNLIANSLDALSDHGTLKLRLSNSRRLHDGSDRPCVRVTVADDGKGIDAASRGRIFEPLFTTKGAIGTGLGLWVSKQIIEKHGGSIRVHSRTGGAWRGTTFSIVLPVETMALGAPNAD